ncbi:unnamed protein product, partial [Prorocentrum cordatum]
AEEPRARGGAPRAGRAGQDNSLQGPALAAASSAPSSPQRSAPAELAGEASAFLRTFRRKSSTEGLQAVAGPWSQAATQSSAGGAAPSAALARSVQLLHALRRAVRRVASDGEGGDEADTEEGTLLQSTLLNLGDSSGQLRQLEEYMVRHVGLAAEAGGLKHASTALMWRMLEITRRKRQLLQAVEARTEALEAEAARGPEMLREVVAGSLERPPELMKLEVFIAGVARGCRRITRRSSACGGCAARGRCGG